MKALLQLLLRQLLLPTGHGRRLSPLPKESEVASGADGVGRRGWPLARNVSLSGTEGEVEALLDTACRRVAECRRQLQARQRQPPGTVL